MEGTVLVLGGTGAARRLAADLHARGLPVLTSLAGRTSNPSRPPGAVRSGGFGGAAGLHTFLRTTGTAAVVDATHPYAARMSDSAATACARTGTPLLVVSRPSWADRPDAGTWSWVDDHEAAAQAAARLGRRVLLTVGRQAASCYRETLAAYGVVVRVVERADLVTPPAWRVVVARGPFDVESERRLLAVHEIEVLVTKDSGGPETAAKLDAAALAGVEVVAVRRPPLPRGVPAVETVEEACAWCVTVLEQGRHL